jgi:hypothetical protein
MASRTALLPSVIVTKAGSVLINPVHADAKILRARKLPGWFYDGRLLPASDRGQAMKQSHATAALRTM